jgi:hypothetical protein
LSPYISWAGTILVVALKWKVVCMHLLKISAYILKIIFECLQTLAILV